MAAKLTGLAHKIVKELHLVAESCIICTSHSRQPVWKLLHTPSYGLGIHQCWWSWKYSVVPPHND